MITQTAALVHPSAQAQSGSGLLWRVESPAGKEKHLESHHYDGKPGADSGTSELPSTESRKHQWTWTLNSYVGVGDIKPSGPNLLGTRHDFIHFVVFWFSWKDHHIINILRLLHNNNGVATSGSRKVFNQKVTVLLVRPQSGYISCVM